jgi:hypothetical protein
MLYVSSDPESLQRHNLTDYRISGSKMADEDLQGTSARRGSFDLATGYSLTCHWGGLRWVSLSRTVAHSEQQRWMG